MVDGRLIVALDMATAAEAVAACEALLPEVDYFKIGLGLFCAEGPQIIKTLKNMGARVFLDLKLHDIPVQVEQAARTIGAYGVDMMTVHCLGGTAMLSAARAGLEAGAKAVNCPPPIIVGVTILTSLDATDLESAGINGNVEREVGILAGLAKESGINGVVASARETLMLRKKYADDFVIVTPGIRPSWAASADQKRVLTPKEAIAAGSTYLVVGRPITGAANPRDAALRILDEMQN